MYDNENNNGYYNSSDENNGGTYSNSTDGNSNGSDDSVNNSYYDGTDNSNNSGYYNSSDNNSYYNSSNDNGYYNSSDSSSDDFGNGPKKKSKNKGIAIAVAISAVIVIVSLAVVAAIAYRDFDNSGLDQIINNTEEQTQESKYEDIGSTSIAENSASTSTGGVIVTDVSGVVEGAMPSVVAITSKTLVESNSYPQDIFEYYFYGGGGNEYEAYEQEAAGSGIIIDQTDTELLIVTNNHVVEGADSLKIQFNGEDTENVVDGYIKGTDANVDIAVVAVKLEDISSETMKNIKKATIGDSDTVKVGEGVIAIGNALGYGQSVTTGVISAKDREAVIEEKTMTLLQTDAAINGGNSGGALLNAKGEVIGINVAKYSSSGSMTSASVEGMGFAIPISSVKDIINTLETKETRSKVGEEEKGYLGIVGFDVDEENSQQFGLPIGICVQTVNEGSPAHEAGIKQYDVITKFDGQSVTTMTALQNLLDYYKAGEKVNITISRNSGNGYSEKEVTVKLGNKNVIEDLQNY